MMKVRALFFIATWLVNAPAHSGDEDSVIVANTQKLSASFNSPSYDFIKLHDIFHIEKNVRSQLETVLGMSKRALDDVRISRIADTTWIQVSVEGKSYITDYRATQWLGSDLSELYIFNESAKRIVVSNDNKESLIDYARFMSKMREISPVYEAHRTLNGRPTVIYAFVDPSCPRCKEFHLTKMNEWRALGITWVYVPFLIDDNDDAKELAEYVYCAPSIDEVKARVDSVYLKGPEKAGKMIRRSDACGQKEKSVVNSVLTAGFRHGLAGSPMFLTDSGEVFYGTPSLEMAVINKLKEKF
ncbi:DsbA family protein [Alteromonas mediterranea]|nr:hypothetical protein [Alteromonas mediterranea]